MNFVLGSCYRNVNDPPPPQHYWFVLSDPKLDSECIFVANITSWDDFNGDSACRVKAGDHPRIVKDCFVNYEDTKEFKLIELMAVLQKQLISFCEPASTDLLQLMQFGALQSEFCKNKFKKLLTNQRLPRID